MERADLEASWERTSAHLSRAIAAFVDAGGTSEAVTAAVDYLDHNALELSADALADVAEGLQSTVLWASLAAAAQEMQLDDRVVRWVAKTGRYPCPCCGHLVFKEPPGSYNICPICFWEDDPVQLRWPTFGGGANRPSLIEAQAEYGATGAMEQRFLGNVRGAAEDEPLEPGWRPVDSAMDNVESVDALRGAWPDDYTVLYWWRPTYWRTGAPRSTSD
jgi:hypothetical protein